MLRPLAPKTRDQYTRALKRAFGDLPPHAWRADGLQGAPNSTKHMLRAALRRAHAEGNLPAEHFSQLERDLAPAYEIQREVEIPGEDEAQRYEDAAMELPPGLRALALLPLRMGLRADEVCSLPRSAVERAAKTGTLKLVGKGGREETLPARKQTALFEELLTVERKSPRVTLKTAHKNAEDRSRRRRWETVGEILSAGARISQYHALHRLVRQTGVRAGVEQLRPHLLRHAFATRLNRDGASVFTVQRALRHKNLATTQRYVHASTEDVEKYMR